MSDASILVTGASSGIGAALAEELLARDHSLVVVARRRDPLDRLAAAHPGRVLAVAADIATASGRHDLRTAIGDLPIAHQVHNAGMLAPIGPLATVNDEAWRGHFALNLDAPLFLARDLLDVMHRPGRILLVSSGAAHAAYPGWGPYCTSKAALHMLGQCFNAEWADDGILTASVRPGVVGTAMQELIRQQDAADFPAVERFRALHSDGQLASPDEAARFLADVLLDSSDEAYVNSDWDLRTHRR